jgi:seryl-tRNA synthetase
MAPRTYTADDRWKKAAWGLIEELVARGRWVDAHPEEVSARRREAKRRIGIAQKRMEALVAERKAVKKKLKDGSVDQSAYQRSIAPINKAIRSLGLIVLEQEESNWL